MRISRWYGIQGGLEGSQAVIVCGLEISWASSGCGLEISWAAMKVACKLIGPRLKMIRPEMDYPGPDHQETKGTIHFFNHNHSSSRHLGHRHRRAAGSVHEQRRALGVGLDDHLALTVEVIALGGVVERVHWEHAGGGAALAAFEEDGAGEDVL